MTQNPEKSLSLAYFSQSLTAFDAIFGKIYTRIESEVRADERLCQNSFQRVPYIPPTFSLILPRIQPKHFLHCLDIFKSLAVGSCYV